MSIPRPWFVVIVGVVAVAGVLLLWRGCGAPRDARDGADQETSIPLVSPDIAVELHSVRATVHPGYTDWACILECREVAGCRADVAVEVTYVSQGEERVLHMAGRLDAVQGQSMRIGRAHRPPSPVDRVEQVTVKVRATFIPGAPRPTLVQ